MNNKSQLLQGRADITPGFTLVELLVALGLVSLLMLLFAEVFQIATGTMTTQRGVMENDQRARSVTTVLRGDLSRRSFRTVIPWTPREDDDALTTADKIFARRGYFSISENDNNNQADDVLQFTVDGSQDSTVTGIPPSKYYGRAAYLDINDPLRSTLLQRGRPIIAANAGAPGSGYFDINDQDPAPGINQRPYAVTLSPGDLILVSGSTGNDGYYVVSAVFPSGATTRIMVSTDIASSTADGRVFRSTSQEPDADDGQIGNATALSPYAEVSYFVRNGTLYRRVLLIRDSVTPQPLDDGGVSFFDYTDPNYGAFTETAIGSATGDFWRGFDFSAINDGFTPGAQFHGVASLFCNVTGGVNSLGMPRNRFGHQRLKLNPYPGPPTYVLAEGRPREFVGPANDIFIGRFTQHETSDTDFNYPQGFSTGNINPMDPTTTLTMSPNGSVQPFHDELTGTRRGEDILLTNVHSFDVKVWDYGLKDFVDVGHAKPLGAFYFDASNPLSEGDSNLQPAFGPQPVNFGKNRMFDTWHPKYDMDQDGAADVPPYLPLENDPKLGSATPWEPSHSYAVDQVVVPTKYRATSPSPPIPRHLAFKCVGAGTSGGSEPSWPLLSQDSATVLDGGVEWQPIYNLQPLKAIKITIRYLDVSSDQMRQVTLIQSLVD